MQPKPEDENVLIDSPGPGTIPGAERIRRKRGPSLTRRIGQNGNVFQKTANWDPAAPAYGRYWIDIPGADRKRRTVTLGVCATRNVARRKLREHIDREGVNSTAAFATNTAPATTFRAQAARWIEYLSQRRRKPVKPATISGWRDSLNKWVLPHCGDLQLAEVGNAVLKGMIDKLHAAGLSTQSIISYTKVIKMVVASAVNAEGEQLYPRKWNHDFVGMPILRKEDQHRPTVNETEISEILASAKRRYAVLFALLAGTGLRIGEALALKSTDLSPDCQIIFVRRSIWRGQEQQPKTPNAVREVDLPESLARVLHAHAENKSGYLFATRSGRPLAQRNVLRALHATGKKVGLHSFRRFRTERLRRARVPEDLTKLWLGHSKETETDFYALGLQKDLPWRREWAEKVGPGFSLLGLLGLQNVVQIDNVKVA